MPYSKDKQVSSNRLRPKPSMANKDNKGNGLADSRAIEAGRIKPKPSMANKDNNGMSVERHPLYEHGRIKEKPSMANKDNVTRKPGEGVFEQHKRLRPKPSAKNRPKDPKQREQRSTGKKQAASEVNLLVLPSYMEYLHQTFNPTGARRTYDVHHWLTRAKIKQNDFFVVMVEHYEHIYEIHGSMSPDVYIEQKGMENLMAHSIRLFEGWLKSSFANKTDREVFIPMLSEIRKDPAKAVAITRYFGKIRRETKEGGSAPDPEMLAYEKRSKINDLALCP